MGAQRAKKKERKTGSKIGASVVSALAAAESTNARILRSLEWKFRITSVNPCISMHGARQSRVMCNRVKWPESIDSLNGFLECDCECHVEQGFAPSCLGYSVASRLYAHAGERIEIRSQPRHNINQHLPEKSILN